MNDLMIKNRRPGKRVTLLVNGKLTVAAYTGETLFAARLAASIRTFDPQTRHPVIDLMPEQVGVTRKGATMRLGTYPCVLRKGSLAHRIYGAENIQERHRHRFEVNNSYRAALEAAGMVLSGISPDSRLVEIIELRDHPWLVASQFHPEFKSRPECPHPLFHGFVATALALLDGIEPRLTAVGPGPSRDEEAHSTERPCAVEATGAAE